MIVCDMPSVISEGFVPMLHREKMPQRTWVGVEGWAERRQYECLELVVVRGVVFPAVHAADTSTIVGTASRQLRVEHDRVSPFRRPLRRRGTVKRVNIRVRNLPVSNNAPAESHCL